MCKCNQYDISRIDSIGQNGNYGEHYDYIRIIDGATCGFDQETKQWVTLEPAPKDLLTTYGKDTVMSPEFRKALEGEPELRDGLDPKSRYYDAGGIETLDIIKAKLTPEEYRGYCKGNAIKYLCRMAFKHDDPTRDIDKVVNYAINLKET